MPDIERITNASEFAEMQRKLEATYPKNSLIGIHAAETADLCADAIGLLSCLDWELIGNNEDYKSAAFYLFGTVRDALHWESQRKHYEASIGDES